MRNFLDFEQPIADLEGKIEELRHIANDDGLNIADEVGKLQTKAERMLVQTYDNLTPWQKVQVARHPERPHFTDYVNALISDYTPLDGDRAFADDKAIQGGIGRFCGYSCMVIGHEKGHDTNSRIKHNFGMAMPEGYRKAIRLLEMANHFNLPVITFVDTPGAFPGISAEERGQAEAIARSIEKCLEIKVPLIAAIVGEGGSGGAIALASADSVLMFEHSVYSVISPEGCASILWHSANEAKKAAEALKLTAQDLIKLDIISQIVAEPIGGAHRDPVSAMQSLGKAIESELIKYIDMDGGIIRAKRRERFLNIGRKEA